MGRQPLSVHPLVHSCFSECRIHFFDQGSGSGSVRLNLGCGNKRKEGFLGVDKFPCEAVDIAADLNETLPFAENAVTELWMGNVIEHIPDIPHLMKEVHRICRHDARITIRTPHFTSVASWRDPTHLHHLSYFSMNHFERPEVAHYTGGGFRVVGRRLSFGGGVMGLIGRAIFALSPQKYEAKWCFIFRASSLQFELKVLKVATS